MRLTLNLDTGQLQASPADLEPLPLVRATLGDASFDVRLLSSKALLTPLISAGLLVAAARIELVVKPDQAGHPNIGADPVVSGGVDIIAALTTTTQLVSLGEDWRSAAAIALLNAGQDFVNLWGQFRWRNGAQPDAPWSYSLFFAIQVQNCLFPDAFIPPGAVLTSGGEYWIRAIDAYVGSPTSLEALPGAGFADLDLIKVRIGGLLSFWVVRKPATENTSVDEQPGIIRLTDGTAHLEKVAGL